MDLQTKKLELIKLIADVQSEQLLTLIKSFLINAEKKKNTPKFSAEESALILKINEELPIAIQVSYQELLQKSVKNTLSASEQVELLKITPIVEAKSVERLKYLYKLSLLWNTTVDDVMNRLQIKPPPVIHA